MGRTEAGGKGPEFICPALEGHLQEPPGPCVHRNVEISVLQVNAVGPHFQKKRSSEGLCRLYFETFGFQELFQGPGLGSLQSLFLAFRDLGNPQSLKGRFWLRVWGRGLGRWVAAAMALMLVCSEKSWAEASTCATTGLVLPSKEPIPQEGGRSQGHLLLVSDAGVHRSDHTVPLLKGSSCHEVDETPAVMMLNWRIALTTDSSEVRNREGDVQDSSMVREARNLEPHMFKEREAMALCMSLAWARS